MIVQISLQILKILMCLQFTSTHMWRRVKKELFNRVEDNSKFQSTAKPKQSWQQAASGCRSVGTAPRLARAAPGGAWVSLDDPQGVARLYCGAQTSVYARAGSGTVAFVAADCEQCINELERPRAESNERLDAEWAEADTAVEVSILPALCGFSSTGGGTSCRRRGR